jgi:hypothetical protein
VIGAYWTRTNDVEIDIVGADRGPIARTLLFVGSIKWLDRSPFDDHDLAGVTPQRHSSTVAPLWLVDPTHPQRTCERKGPP